MFSKKVLSMALTAALALSAAPVFAGTQYKDVNDAKLADGYNNAINFLSGLGIVSGDNNGNFNPNDNVKRSEVAKIIDNTLGYSKLVSTSKTTATKFTDVAKDNWAAGYVNVAAQKGLVKGVSDTKFAPDDNVTYAQYLTIALRALGYNDDDLTGTWPLNYVTKAVEVGLLDGLENVDPNDKATRKDIAVITQNTLKTVTKDDTYNTTLGAFKGTLLTHVSKALGLQEVKGYVVADKTTDATLADSVKIVTATDYKGDVQPSNRATIENSKDYPTGTYTFNLTDDQKAKFAVGGYVDFYATTNITNNNKIVYVVDNKRDVKVITPVLTDAKTTLDTVASNTYFNYKVGDTATKAVVDSNEVYTIINGKHDANDKIANLDVNNYDLNVTLVDNKGDAKYDFAIVTSVKKPAMITKDALATDTVLKTNKGDVSLQTQDSTGVKVNSTVKVTGSVSNLADIKRGDVVYVTAPTDNSTVNVEVVRAPFSAKVTAKTVDGAKTKTVTVNGAVYSLDDSIATQTINVDDTVNFTAIGKNNLVLAFNTTSSAVDLTAYGVPVVAEPRTSYGVTSYYVKVAKLDGTVPELTVDAATYGNFDALYKKQVVKVTTTNGVSKFDSVTTTGYSSASKVGDTKLYIAKYKADGSFDSTYASDFSLVDLTKPGTVYTIAKPGATLGDYAAVIFVAPATSVGTAVNTDTTAYGYLKAQTGTTYVGTQKVNVWEARVNGQTVTLNVKDGITPVVSLTAGSFFSKAVTDSNGVVTDLAGVPATASGLVGGIDATRVNVNGTTYTFDANAKIYDKDNNVITASDLKFRFDNLQIVNGVKETISATVVVSDTANSKVTIVRLNN